MGEHTTLSPMQKLIAVAQRFYHYQKWSPVAGDYYTTSRADLELYKIVKIEDGIVFTTYLPETGNLAEWPVNEFLSPETFGAHRVWVQPFVLEIDKTTEL